MHRHQVGPPNISFSKPWQGYSLPWTLPSTSNCGTGQQGTQRSVGRRFRGMHSKMEISKHYHFMCVFLQFKDFLVYVDLQRHTLLSKPAGPQTKAEKCSQALPALGHLHEPANRNRPCEYMLGLAGERKKMNELSKHQYHISN